MEENREAEARAAPLNPLLTAAADGFRSLRKHLLLICAGAAAPEATRFMADQAGELAALYDKEAAAQPPTDSVADLREARRLLDAAIETLGRYADHDPSCPAQPEAMLAFRVCECGLNAALDALPKPKPVGERSRELCGACLAGVLCARHAGKEQNG